MLRVTPLYGSRYDNKIASQESSCTLIEFGGVRIIWNVGYRTDLSLVDSIHSNSSSNYNNIPLGMDLPEHDVLLISDSTLASCGGLPLYYRQQKNQNQNQQQPVKAYATFPTVKMGQMTMYDLHARISLDGGQPPFTLEELDASFALLQTIKYAQIINIHANSLSSSTTTTASSSSTPLLRITAQRSGHVIGGSFFCLQRVVDDTMVVLTTPRYHMAKELHLDSSTLLKYASTPDVLVCYPGGPAFSLLQHVYNHQQDKKSSGSGMSSKSIKTKKQSTASTTAPPSSSTLPTTAPSSTTSAAMPLVTQAQRSLTELVLAVVRREGNVLLPVDASGRVWELLLLLHTHWERHRLSGAYHLIWIGPMVWNTWELGSSQLEWMATALGSQFDSQRGHPLILQHVHKFISVTEMEQWLQKHQQSNNPLCVVASGADLEGGPARDLLLQWSDNPDHAVIFTDSSQCVLRPAAVLTAAAALERRGVPPTMALTTSLSSLPPATDMDNSIDLTDATKSAVAYPAAPTTVAAAVVGATSASTTAAATGEEEEGVDGGTLVGSAVTRMSPYSTAAQLLVKWCEAQVEGREMDDCVEVDVNVPRRAPLAGPELKAFLEKEEALRLEKKRLEEQRAMLREVELAKGQLRLGEVAGSAATTSTATASVVGTGESGTPATSTSNTGVDGTETTQAASKVTSGEGPRPKKKTKFDTTLFLKFSKPLHLTFEVREEAVGVGQSDSVAKYGIGESIGRSGEVLEDDYGIAVIPERFVDIVTGIDPGKLTGRIGDDRNTRGFGLAASVTPEANAKSKLSSEDDVILMDEQALEAADLSEGFGIIRGRNGRPPTKVMTVPRKLEVFCEIAYVPLEGRVDSRAARQSVRALQPRQVVILGGSKQHQLEEDESSPSYLNLKNTELVAIDEVAFLGDAVRSFGPSVSSQEERVFTPSDLETSELSVGHAAYFVRLINTPFRRPEEVDESGEPPEPVEPFEAQLGECTVSLLDCVATGQRVALDGSIVLAPHAQAATTWKESQRSCLYLSDGDVLLTNLRAELIAQGLKADYSAHTGYAQLIVNGKVVVKKDQESGKIHLEGPLTEDFFTVRSIVCGQYVTLQ